MKTANKTGNVYSFLMSSYEYEFAKEHIDFYDIALVFGSGAIKIYKAFLKENIEPAVHTYEVSILENEI